MRTHQAIALHRSYYAVFGECPHDQYIGIHSINILPRHYNEPTVRVSGRFYIDSRPVMQNSIMGEIFITINVEVGIDISVFSKGNFSSDTLSVYFFIRLRTHAAILRTIPQRIAFAFFAQKLSQLLFRSV